MEAITLSKCVKKIPFVYPVRIYNVSKKRFYVLRVLLLVSILSTPCYFNENSFVIFKFMPPRKTEKKAISAIAGRDFIEIKVWFFEV